MIILPGDAVAPDATPCNELAGQPDVVVQILQRARGG